MNKLKNFKNILVANKSVIGQKALQLGGVALGAFIAGSVLAKTQPEADLIIIDGDVDVTIEETTVIEETTTKN